jgi:hypothetical protein
MFLRSILLNSLPITSTGSFHVLFVEPVEGGELFLRITGVSDFIHRPDSNNYKKKEEQTRRFGNWICFRPQMRGDT